MAKVLILYAHPRNDRSLANALLAERAKALDGVTLVDLYGEYPTFEIDVDREQGRLLTHDVFVFQHPVYWYSSPSILKEWQDLVLEHGFAYGAGTRKLAGKVLFNAVTAGARRETYTVEGSNRHELRQLFAPFEQTAALCRIRYLPPFALFAAGHATDEDRLAAHVDDYELLLTALVDERFDIAGASSADTISKDLNTWITTQAEVT